MYVKMIFHSPRTKHISSYADYKCTCFPLQSAMYLSNNHSTATNRISCVHIKAQRSKHYTNSSHQWHQQQQHFIPFSIFWHSLEFIVTFLSAPHIFFLCILFSIRLVLFILFYACISLALKLCNIPSFWHSLDLCNMFHPHLNKIK